MSPVTGLFFPVLLLNQRWSPPLRLQASHCSTFRIMCDVPSTAVFCNEYIYLLLLLLLLLLYFKDFIIVRFQLLYYKNLHKTDVKHLNCKLYYQQLHLKYLCNLARYWLQAVWGWHDSVETCSSVIICEIIVHLLVIVQNKKKTPPTQLL